MTIFLFLIGKTGAGFVGSGDACEESGWKFLFLIGGTYSCDPVVGMNSGGDG